MSWLMSALLLVVVVVLLVAWSRSRAESDRVERTNQKLARDGRLLLDFMHHMTEALGEGLSHQELRQRIVHASILCTGALSACFFERTPRNTLRGVAVEGLFPPHRPMTEATQSRLLTRARFIEQVLRSEEFPVGEGVVGRVAEQLRGELLVDAAADPRMVRHDDPALKVRSVIVVPLLFRGRSFGVLAVANPGGETFFNEADFALLQSLAEQAALALHNAEFLHLQVERRQLDVDLAVARGIQQMLLPREVPALPGLELDARYAAAQQVGGDLYDFVLLPDSRLGIVVADVSGKGIAASMLMAICRTNFRQIALRHHSPAAALIELNRTMSIDIQAGLYVTMIYAIVDTAQSTVTFARAGHELPLFVRRDPAHGLARADYVASEGMALGLVPDEIFVPAISDGVEPFLRGDALVLYTDGVTETPNDDGKEFSGARLADVARMLHHRPAHEVNDHVMEALQRFSGGGHQRDDLTLVTVRRTAG